jgi:hypothetical protein
MEMDLIRSVLAGQAQNNDCKNALSEALRGVMIKALVDQMKEEVVTLCGPHYHPAPESAHKRAGSTSGKFRLNGAEAGPGSMAEDVCGGPGCRPSPGRDIAGSDQRGEHPGYAAGTSERTGIQRQ